MKDTINLLPKKTVEEKGVKRQKQRVYVLVGGAIFLLVLVWVIPLVILANAKNTEQELLVQIGQKEDSLGKLSASENLYRDIFQRASAASVLLEERNAFLQTTKNVASLVSADLVIRNVVIDKNHVKLTVAATSLAPVLAYLESLENGEKIGKFMTKAAISSILIGKTVGYAVVLEGDL